LPGRRTTPARGLLLLPGTTLEEPLPRKRTTGGAAASSRGTKRPGTAPDTSQGATEDQPAPDPAGMAARELYLREKARRQGQDAAREDPLADAKREYEALLAADVAAGKGGRPRKNAKKVVIPRGTDETAADDEEAVDDPQ
jgi:hypothetical protein